MGRFWTKLLGWIKVAIIAVLLIYILTFVICNYGETAKFWVWFGGPKEVPTLKLAFLAFIGGVLLTILVQTTIRTLQQLRDLRQKPRSLPVLPNEPKTEAEIGKSGASTGKT